MSEGVPVVCDSCGFRDLVPGVFGGTATNVTMVGNRVNCPNCDKWARVVDARYDIDDSVFTMTAGSPQAWREFAQILSDERWTRERAEMVARALRSVEQGRKPEFVAEKVRRIDRQLGDWLLQILRDPATHSILAVLGMVVAILIARGVFDAGSPEPDQITRIVEQVNPSHTPEPPSSPPSTEPGPPTPSGQDPPERP